MSEKPLYSQVLEYIDEKIHSKEWKEGDKIPSEKELTKMFNVSSTTVKRALRELQVMGLIVSRKGSGSFVAKQISKQVKDSPGYRKMDSRIISFVLPLNATAQEVKDYVAGASSYLQTKGYFLTVHVTSGNVEKEKELLLDLAEQNVGGIIFYPCFSSKNAATVMTMRMNGVPIVTIDKNYETQSISSVMSDNFRGGFLSGDYLIRQGHRNISYLSNIAIENSTSVRDRYMGFCDALAKHGIQNDISNHLVDCTFESEIFRKGGVEEFQYHTEEYAEFLRMIKRKGVTALVCSCDVFAYWILNLCKKIGYRVPEDFSIIGFDKINFPYKSKQLTTIKQDFYCIGYKAAEEIWKIINLNAENSSIVLPVEFVQGKTVKSMLEKENEVFEQYIG